MKALLAIFAFLALFSMAAAIETSPCSDGTPYGKCSTKNPGYYCTGSISSPSLQPYVSLCPCSSVPGWVQQGSGENATCVQAKCDDGTRSGECSPTKPKVCIGGSAYADNATKCGCPQGKRVSANGIFCEPIPCTYDGETVNEGMCSAKKWKMCANGSMVDAASKCGCPSGMKQVGEKCVPTCVDGTAENECSNTPPKRCINGVLVDDAEACGCPSGQSRVGKNCASGLLGALGSGGSAELVNQSQSGTQSQPSALSCCCLPTAMIVLVGGFAAFGKKN